jgi:glutathione S-transferase
MELIQEEKRMHAVALIILLALLEFMALGGMVGYARGKYGVKAPAITGHEVFERHFRVHYNTMEQLVVFIPSIWLFATYISTSWATILGAVFIVGRVLYAVGYVRDPKKREFGSFLSSAGQLPLFFGALYGVVKAILA